LGEPPHGGLDTEQPREIRMVRAQLTDAVALRQQRQHRLVHPGGDQLDLPSVDEVADLLDAIGYVLLHPFEERAGPVHGDAQAGAFLDEVEDGPIGDAKSVLEDPVEVSRRLMSVQDEAQVHWSTTSDAWSPVSSGTSISVQSGGMVSSIE